MHVIPKKLSTRLRLVGIAIALVMLAAFAAGVPTTADSAKSERGASQQDRHATRAASSPALVRPPSSQLPLSGRAEPRADGGVSGAVPQHAHGHEEEEVENGEAKNPTSNRQLQYHNGGAVQTSPRIYLVLWGPSWNTNGDPNGVANRLHYFYQGLGGSNYANALKQFSGSTGAFTNPTGQYKGWIRDTSSVPAQPTKAQVQAAAVRAAQRLNDFNYNAQYVIATPWGVVDQYATAQSFCGWHDWTYAGGNGNWVTYTSLPYMPYMDAIGRGCGGGTVNGATNGKLDGVTILASHGYAESVNNPGLNAWFDSDGSENADKCSWVNLSNYRLVNGYTLPVQPYWSNAWRSTYGYGCYYS
jgi:serine protease